MREGEAISPSRDEERRRKRERGKREKREEKERSPSSSLATEVISVARRREER